MAPSVVSAVPEYSLTLTGLLVATLDLQRRPARHEPLDTAWFFRDGSHWMVLTLARVERWPDSGTGAGTGAARITVDRCGTLVDLEALVLVRYGSSGWREVLDAGHLHDGDLHRAWVPIAIERDLDRASLYRRDVDVCCLDEEARDALALDAAAHLRTLGFDVRKVTPPTRNPDPGENPLVAEVAVRRYGREVDVVIRVDYEGEVYARITDETSIREVGDDDG